MKSRTTLLRHSFLTLGGYHDHIVYRVEPYCGENIVLTSFLESHIRGLGFVLPRDCKRRPFLPRELSDYAEYIAYAKKIGALPWKSRLFFGISNHITQWLLEKLIQWWLGVRATSLVD